MAITQCEKCLIKWNNESKAICPMCNLKEKQKPPSRKKRSKQWYKDVALRKSKIELFKDFHSFKPKHHYYSAGKQKNYNEPK